MCVMQTVDEAAKTRKTVFHAVRRGSGNDASRSCHTGQSVQAFQTCQEVITIHLLARPGLLATASSRLTDLTVVGRFMFACTDWAAEPLLN